MNTTRIARSLILASSLTLAGGLAAAHAQEAPEPRTWTNSTELSLVLTTGNAETQTLGVKNTLEGRWDRVSFRLKVGAIRAESTDETRYAVGTVEDHDLDSVSETNTTAEAYDVEARGDRNFGQRHAWFGEARWDRNEFAGVRNRLQLTSGLATTWKDGPRVRFRTDAGLSWTTQDDVVSKDEGSDSWMGLRLGWELRTKIGASAEYGNDLLVDQNLNETDDLRVDMTNWLSVSFTKRLALKVSHQVLFDGDPQLEEVYLFDPADLTTPTGQVTAELDDIDSVLTASLVVTF